MSGIESINRICKHVDGNGTYWADLEPVLVGGRTVASITGVTPSDTTLIATVPTVLSVATTVVSKSRDTEGNTTTLTYVIAANKGCSFRLAGGATGAGLSKVKVEFVDSAGETDSAELLIQVEGTT